MRGIWILLLASLVLPPVLAAQDTTAAQVEPVAMRDSTLLVFSSGEPFMTITDIKDPGLLDAISSPTPRQRNTAQVAQIIFDELSAAGAKVRLARVEDFEKDDWREVMGYRTVILGSPARFWNVSWEMKRFIDLVLGRIYIHPDRAKNTQFAIFSTAEIESSAADCLAAMEKVIGDCDGAVIGKLNTHHQQSEEDYQAAVEKFCKIMAILAH